MGVVANRRSVMTLFSNAEDATSHRVRFVMAEKGITNIDIVEVKEGEECEDLLDLNPYNTVPTLVDRDLVLYEPGIVAEYLDERFPHPPLMPVDPVSRARFRMVLHRIEQDMYAHMPALASGKSAQVRKAKKALQEHIAASSEVFSHKPFFLSDEFSLVDCSLAPVLWRLDYYGVALPKNSTAIEKYKKRIFSRPGFQRSLTQIESEMQDS